MMDTVYKQGDNIQTYCIPFPIWNLSTAPCLVLTIASRPENRFLRKQVRWSGIPISQNFPRPPGSSVSRDSPGKNIRVGCHVLLQGIFPTQGSNPGVLHCRWILYSLSHQESPRILKWIAYPFSSRSSRHRNWTGVSCIAGRFFTSWAIRKAHNCCISCLRYQQHCGSLRNDHAVLKLHTIAHINT